MSAKEWTPTGVLGPWGVTRGTAVNAAGATTSPTWMVSATRQSPRVNPTAGVPGSNASSTATSRMIRKISGTVDRASLISVVVKGAMASVKACASLMASVMPATWSFSTSSAVKRASGSTSAIFRMTT